MASDFTYNYYSGTNKLQNLNGGANYIYDEIGNLIADPSQNVTSIDWTPYGKVRQVTKGDGTTVSFKYDGSGNRIEKVTTSGGTTTILHYIRDASGNVMAMYENDTLQSQPIYGSSRLGMYKGGNRTGERNLGNKQYELSNHLGNVLAVVTDNINMSNDSTTATVVSASDYYPFGLEMPGRTFSSTAYKYGFNGKEKDDKGEFGSTVYDYGFRVYNPEIGKFLSVDPLTASYPWYTPYQFAGNKPIWAMDLDGLEEEVYILSKNYSKEINGILKSEKPDYELVNYKLNYNLNLEFKDRWMHDQIQNSKNEIIIPNYNLESSNNVIHRNNTNERAKGILIFGIFEKEGGDFEKKLIYKNLTKHEEWYMDARFFGNFDINRTYYDMGYDRGFDGEKLIAIITGVFLTNPYGNNFYSQMNFKHSEGFNDGESDDNSWRPKYSSHKYFIKFPEMYEGSVGEQPIDVKPRDPISGEVVSNEKE